MTSTFTLPAGTVCHRNGIPFVLQHATQIECHPENWPLIEGEQRTLHLSDTCNGGISIQFGDDVPLQASTDEARLLAHRLSLRANGVIPLESDCTASTPVTYSLRDVDEEVISSPSSISIEG